MVISLRQRGFNPDLLWLIANRIMGGSWRPYNNSLALLVLPIFFLPSLSHSMVVASHFSRVASRLALVIHSM